MDAAGLNRDISSIIVAVEGGAQLAYDYWDSAYRSGQVPWDPGDHDAHLPNVLHRAGVQPGRVLDIGCGTGKSLIWLGGMGFAGTGIDSAPTALARARELAERRGVTCTWILGSFPDDFGPETIPDGSFPFVMDRGWFHLHTNRAEQRRIVARIVGILPPGGCWYSLIAARGRGTGFAGPPRWSDSEVRRAMTPELEIDTLELSVFTPGEAGSMPAWICITKRKG